MISIITPAFIDEEIKNDWLNEAIASIKKQSLTNWELILIDDKSPIAPKFEKDERIRLFRLAERSGPALARNTGVALASFDAILPLDADDQLANEDTLQIMYEAWEEDKTQVIYGNLQRLTRIETENRWQLGKIIPLPNYTFEGSLTFLGTIPVTAIHSKECHLKAGGWKKELDYGLEDVEYWIAAGKSGHCGKHLSIVTLIYRRSDKSRSYHLRNVNKKEVEMRNKIRMIHQDVFEGRYPVGCCSGQSRTPQPRAGITQFTELKDVERKVVVEYIGKRTGSWQVRGDTHIVYVIQGPGHKLEIDVKDRDKFRQHGRGKDFLVGVEKPVADNGQQSNKEVAVFQASTPQIAMVERLDKKAMAVNG